jgi:anti-sigma regulatory factor (Ser/Thr protein kinase)
VHRAFPSHPSSLHDIRGFLREQAAESGLPGDAVNDLVLAASEACANAVLHSGSGLIEVTWVDSIDRVEVQVADQGVFNRRVPLQEAEGSGGHGIQMMMALMDEVTVREGTEIRPGTLVRLVKFRDGI